MASQPTQPGQPGQPNQPARPKQRVLVRWNDDLDKSLLLFITHTCTEMGIKIPYDEIARRMGSTFSEGAIQQHISKLRNKMAELNVAPVPAPAKRGAVTVKPSSVYGQKGRAGPAPQQPVASKSQARAAGNQSDNNTTAGATTTPKRSGRRKQATIKRSESDEGPTDDEFGGASDDDFQANPNTSGKRGRGTTRQGPASKRVVPFQPPEGGEADKIYKSLAQADARHDAFMAAHAHLDLTKVPVMLVQQWIADFAANGQVINPPGAVSHYGQLTQTTGFAEDEEEEEEEEPTQMPNQMDASGRFIVPAYDPEQFGFSRDEQLSPTSISRMPTQVGPFLQYGGPHATTNPSNNFQQISQLSVFQNNGYNPNNSESNFTNRLLAPQPGRSFQPVHMNSQMPAPYPPATITTIPSYGSMQQPARNDSMVSSSSQNTFAYPPQTPTISPAAGVNSAHQSPFNDWVNIEFNESNTAPHQMVNEWGFDDGLGANHTYDNTPVNDGANANSFVNQLFG